MKGKYMETKFEKSLVIQQPNAFKSQRQSILGKPAIFSDSLAKKDFSKSKPVTTQNVSNDFSKTVTAQILPHNMLPIVKNTNVIAPGLYKVHTKPNQTRTPQLHQDIRKPNKHVSFFTGVIPNTRVSRPQLKSNHLEDRVMSNNSQGKKQEVEDTNFWERSSLEMIKLHQFLAMEIWFKERLLSKGFITLEGLIYFFSVGQFCDADLEVAFRKSTCYIRDLKGNDLLTDETPGVLIDFLTLVQRGLHAQVTTVRTDKGTKFLNKTLHAYFAKEGIRHETSTARTPEQNGVVERRNRTLVEAARTMLSAAKVPLFFWAEAIATTCFTQNRSLVIPRLGDTLIIHHAPEPSVMFFSSLVLFATSSEMTPVQERGETSSRHVDSSNMHTFYQHHPSTQRWTKDHPLDSIGNLLNQLKKQASKSKEPLKSMARCVMEDLHQFDRLRCWE
ncbi:retrovirus-related pol polyprotein from transposon TNT 1-94 [Tanacetum coccineum]